MQHIDIFFPNNLIANTIRYQSYSTTTYKMKDGSEVRKTNDIPLTKVSIKLKYLSQQDFDEVSAFYNLTQGSLNSFYVRLQNSKLELEKKDGASFFTLKEEVNAKLSNAEDGSIKLFGDGVEILPQDYTRDGGEIDLQGGTYSKVEISFAEVLRVRFVIDDPKVTNISNGLIEVGVIELLQA